MNTKRVYLTAHPSPTHTHTQRHAHLVYTIRTSSLNLSYEQTSTWLTDTNIPGVVEGHLRPTNVFELLSGTEPQGGANRPLLFSQLQIKSAEPIGTKSP